MTKMSIQPLWLTHFIEILLVLEFQLTRTYFDAFSYKAHLKPQISSNDVSMCSQQSTYLVSYSSGTSMTQSSDDTLQHQPTLMKHHSTASGSIPKVWPQPYSPSSQTSSGSLLHTSLVSRRFHLHFATSMPRKQCIIPKSFISNSE